MEFKDVFKERRQALKLSLKDIADAVGVSVPTVQRWESGEIKNLRRDKIYKLVSILDVPVEKLMGWDDRPATIALSRADNKYDDLPEEAQQEIENFIAYTRQKYKKKN